MSSAEDGPQGSRERNVRVPTKAVRLGPVQVPAVLVQFVKFGIVGISNTLITFIVYTILLRVLDRFNRKTTESSLDLWVPPEFVNRALELPLSLEAALIARGGRIPAGLSLLSVFR